MMATDALCAPAAVRDRFLGALDARDHALSTRLALNLTGCMNPPPGMTCGELVYRQEVPTALRQDACWYSIQSLNSPEASEQ